MAGFFTWFQPRKPQTGDGKTRRDPFDRVRLVYRDASGKKIKLKKVRKK